MVSRWGGGNPNARQASDITLSGELELRLAFYIPANSSTAADVMYVRAGLSDEAADKSP